MVTPVSVPAEGGDSLALAVITSSSTPLLLIDGNLAIVAASRSFCEAFSLDPADVAGAPLASLGAGEWNLPQLASLLKATAAGAAEIDAYELDLARDGKVTRQLVVNARRLDLADLAGDRLLVAVADVTEARVNAKLKDDLLHEKAILLQELQHRVANSLQIIASVLMQSARKVRSEQARGHLRDARNRVMSIATMQRQLAAGTHGDVALRAYFTDLCASIGASMIRDHDQLSLNVKVDESMIKADISVSLGLIVTELVINALKHAFPHHRKGTIGVDFASDGPAWTLSVRDTGVGMPSGGPGAKAGLGTGIVEALSKHLGATVRIIAAEPGTRVSIAHPGAPAAQVPPGLAQHHPVAADFDSTDLAEHVLAEQRDRKLVGDGGANAARLEAAEAQPVDGDGGHLDGAAEPAGICALLGQVDAGALRVLRGQRDDRGAGIDHEVDRGAVDLHDRVEMPVRGASQLARAGHAGGRRGGGLAAVLARNLLGRRGRLPRIVRHARRQQGGADHDEAGKG
ncbi:MAG TPA: histidine kinase dimerization/phosphoacceptor domain -containing protein, partial [Allosphingosinicella sp.]|nr:histidine kinase dimerization/phosphoacceptor domain -containing protein [Allosphingosinicella sp.]